MASACECILGLGQRWLLLETRPGHVGCHQCARTATSDCGATITFDGSPELERRGPSPFQASRVACQIGLNCESRTHDVQGLWRVAAPTCRSTRPRSTRCVTRYALRATRVEKGVRQPLPHEKDGFKGGYKVAAVRKGGLDSHYRSKLRENPEACTVWVHQQCSTRAPANRHSSTPATNCRALTSMRCAL